MAVGPVEVGMRLIRGPDWAGGEADGGEGYLGTLKALLGGGRVMVQWDHGGRTAFRAGAEGRFELRILDTAQVGVRHVGASCVACGDKDVHGMLWRCLEPACQGQGQGQGCTLCSLCYVTDVHDIKHVFERIDAEGMPGVTVKKRSTSLKVRAMGIFPGAVVSRGPDWAWGDQDGGSGSTGEVLGFENVALTSSRNLVRVCWSGTQVTNSYRLGFEGHVDLQCTEEAAGTYYYRDHLPVLDATSTSPRRKWDQLPTRVAAGGGGGVGDPPPGDRKVVEELRVGDAVAIVVDEDRLKELQAEYGGTTASMLQCIGKTGEVISLAAKGALQVKYKRLSYRLNPQVLVKVPRLAVGDTVRICEDLSTAKTLNRVVGWKPDMDSTRGKVGRVVKMDGEGRVAVTFGHIVHLYSPSCCLLAPGATTDVLTSSPDGRTRGATSSPSSSSSGQQSLHERLMMLVASASQAVEPRGGSDDMAGEMQQLFCALARRDLEGVTAVCSADPRLLTALHKGLTLLMVAAHEGQDDVIEALLGLGADLDGQGEDGNTALAAALEGKQESTALYLLERGASVSHANNKRRSPAHFAAYNNLPEALRSIIRHGADVNYRDSFGDAPLHDAIERDNLESIEALLDAPGLDLQVLNQKGFTALQLACLRGHAFAVDSILRRTTTRVDDLMDSDFSALHIAVTNDHVDCARLLLEKGNAAINVVGARGLTPLHLACNEAYTDAATLLLDHGANIQVTADDGNTPLHLAVGTKSMQLRKNHSASLEQSENASRVRIACLLIERGAFVDARNKQGAEPLQCCQTENILTPVQTFIDNNPLVVRRLRGGAAADAERAELREAMSSLLLHSSDSTKRQLLDQCKQS